MTEFYLTIALAILCLVTAGILMWRSGLDQQRQRRNLHRLQTALDRANLQGGFATPPQQRNWATPFIDGWLNRAGYDPTARLYGLLVLPAPIMAFVGGALLGLWGVMVGLMLYPLGLSLFLRWRIERFHDQVVTLLPGFLDSVARILSIGSSLELAFRNASEECKEPLRGITAQMLLRTRAGMAIEDAMNQVAETYAIKDLSFMASVFYLGVRYGGNARAVLERIAQSMRERERGQKELRAMTSETRASAWILSALPILVGLLTLASNPTYLLGMWSDALGRQLLLAAVILQAVGMWLLFRMARLHYR
ncbi:MAG: type II secretion system F family protein [Propionivibrio sp.]|nr:type II secretion system F family protein [Propionivibrio sp.]